MSMIFNGKTGSVTVLNSSPSIILPSFGKILRAVIREMSRRTDGRTDGHTHGHSQVVAQLKLRTKVENCSVLTYLSQL